MTLATNGSDCVVTDGVGTLGGRKNDKVYWHVNNGCSTDQYVVFLDYRKYLTDPPNPSQLGPAVHVVEPDPLSSEKIKIGAFDKKVQGKIDKDYSGSGYDLYKYRICTSPRQIPNPLPSPLPSDIKCLDPDVDIWP